MWGKPEGSVMPQRRVIEGQQAIGSGEVLANKGDVAMWKAVVMAAGLASAVSLGAGISLGQSSPTLQPVEDRGGRFVISVPPTWRVDQSGRDLPALSAFSPEPPETPPDSVEVFVRDLPFPITPPACSQQVAFAMWVTIHQWTTLSEGPDTIGGLAAYSRVYTWHPRNGRERRSLQTCVPLGRRVFVIIGTTQNTPNRVAEVVPALARIMRTFRPGPAPVPAAPGPRGGSDR